MGDLGQRRTASTESAFNDTAVAAAPSFREFDADTTLLVQLDSRAETCRRKRPRAGLGGWCDEARASLRGRKLFTLFAFVNLVNYLDRGVIPGGSQEFNSFIQRNLQTERPDVYLGILQSAFILGFSVACLVFAKLANKKSPFTLMGAGLGVWCLSAIMSGWAKPLESYSFLLLARLLSGVGEASFIIVVPPIITETAPPGERGLWLALFYTAQPLGAGLGFVYGSVLANSRIGWAWAFFFEALIMAPLALLCSLVPEDNATSVSNAADYGASPDQRPHTAQHEDMDSDRHLSSNDDGVKPPVLREEGRPPVLEMDVDSNISLRRSSGRRRSFRRSYSEGRHFSAAASEEDEEGLPLSGIGGGDGIGTAERGVVGVSRQRSGEGRLQRQLSGSWNPRGSRHPDSPPLLEAELSMDWQKYSARAGGDARLACKPSMSGKTLEQQEEPSRNSPAVASLGSINSGPATLAVPREHEVGTGWRSSAIVRDVLEVTDRTVFCLVVWGAAATAAVTAGMSTFGTGFVISLELLTSETAAAATFGGVICAAGLLGTPAGGALIDAADPEGRMDDGRKLSIVLTQAAMLMCGATALLLAATAQSSLGPFLVLFFTGGALLFATASHSNLSVMLAAPKRLRPLALAVNSIAIHVLGDVPSPTVIGALKDALAPHCAVAGGVGTKLKENVFGALNGVRTRDFHETGGGNEWRWSGSSILAGVSEACRRERRAVHVTLFLTVSWLLWTCLCFSLARAVQGAALKRGLGPACWGDIKGKGDRTMAVVPQIM